nr:sulfotransferase 16 [Tanacetum cinerariifolium]
MINDPLYIGSSDHLGMVLTTTPFNGSNFNGWSKNVRMAFDAKLKLGFINGSCVKPDVGDVELQRWIRCFDKHFTKESPFDIGAENEVDDHDDDLDTLDLENRNKQFKEDFGRLLKAKKAKEANKSKKSNKAKKVKLAKEA